MGGFAAPPADEAVPPLLLVPLLAEVPTTNAGAGTAGAAACGRAAAGAGTTPAVNMGVGVGGAPAAAAKPWKGMGLIGMAVGPPPLTLPPPCSAGNGAAIISGL